MSGIQRYFHFGFMVSTLDRTVAFFRDCLGLEVQERGHDAPDGLTVSVASIDGRTNLCGL